MRARAAVQTADETIEIQQFEVPEIGPDQALLQVEANGICGTDYEQYAGVYAKTGMVQYPLIPGHETIGRIVEMGHKARDTWQVNEGDRVAVESIVSCAVCPQCMRGNQRHCLRKFNYGFTKSTVGPGLWGGYADYMLLVPNTVVHLLPEDLTSEDAVLFNPLGGGLDWAYQSLGTGIGDTVVIFGPGQRGLACVVAANEAGAATIIVTGLHRDARKLELAREFGATHTINAEQEDVVERVRELTDGEGADRVIDVTPYATQPVLDAIEAVKPGGVVVLAGIKGMREVPGFVSDKLFMKSITLRGAYAVGSWAYSQAIRLINSRKYPFEKMHTHTLPIDELEYGIQILAGMVKGEEAIHITIVPSR